MNYITRPRPNLVGPRKKGSTRCKRLHESRQCPRNRRRNNKSAADGQKTMTMAASTRNVRRQQPQWAGGAGGSGGAPWTKWRRYANGNCRIVSLFWISSYGHGELSIESHRIPFPTHPIRPEPRWAFSCIYLLLLTGALTLIGRLQCPGRAWPSPSPASNPAMARVQVQC